MLEETLRKALRAVLGGAADISATNPMPVTSAEVAMDSGVATGGTNTTCADTTKNWEVNMWEDAVIEVTIAGVEYHRTIIANTADTLTFNSLPAFVVVAADDVYQIRLVVSGFNPLAKAAIFNTALPAIGNDFLVADITPTNTPSFLRIYIAVAVAGVLSIAREAGGVTIIEYLNHNVNLVADSAYMFDTEWRTGDGINLRFSATGANILVLRCDEIPASCS